LLIFRLVRTIPRLEARRAQIEAEARLRKAAEAMAKAEEIASAATRQRAELAEYAARNALAAHDSRLPVPPLSAGEPLNKSHCSCHCELVTQSRLTSQEVADCFSCD
jgi:hypothetical protein